MFGNQGCTTFGTLIPHATNYILFATPCHELNNIHTTGCESNRILSIWASLRAGTLLFYDKECRKIMVHRRVERYAQLADLWLQVAPPAFTEIGYRLFAEHKKMTTRRSRPLVSPKFAGVPQEGGRVQGWESVC